MNELFPIIRRQRRPLLVTDAPPAMAGNVEPVKVEANAETVARSEELKPSEHASVESSE